MVGGGGPTGPCCALRGPTENAAKSNWSNWSNWESGPPRGPAGSPTRPSSSLAPPGNPVGPVGPVGLYEFLVGPSRSSRGPVGPRRPRLDRCSRCTGEKNLLLLSLWCVESLGAFYARESLTGLTLGPGALSRKTEIVVRPIQHVCYSAAGASSRLCINSSQH